MFFRNACILLFLASSILLMNCRRSDSVDFADELRKVDLAFSDYSEKYGMKAAFLHFCDDSVVMLRSDYDPIIGKENLAALFDKSDESQYYLTWRPQFAKVSQSGDLGYTYGIFKVISKGNEPGKLLGSGTYISVWEKNKDGVWRFVLDSGNEGLDRDRLKKMFMQIKNITGNWKYESINGTFYENWELINDTILKGFSCLIKDNDTAFYENTAIEIRNEDIIYSTILSNQNEGKEIVFKLIQSDNYSFVFANPDHDYPQRIIYNIPLKNDTLHARIEGTKNGNALSSDYYFIPSK